MTEQQKITYDVKDEVQFRLWLRSYVEAYNKQLSNIEKELKTTNNRLGLMVFFFIALPLIFGGCSLLGSI
jgi:hypothetical protein